MAGYELITTTMAPRWLPRDRWLWQTDRTAAWARHPTGFGLADRDYLHRSDRALAPAEDQVPGVQ